MIIHQNKNFVKRFSFILFSVFRSRMLAEEFGSDTDDDDYMPEGTVDSSILYMVVGGGGYIGS